MLQSSSCKKVKKKIYPWESDEKNIYILLKVLICIVTLLDSFMFWYVNIFCS